MAAGSVAGVLKRDIGVSGALLLTLSAITPASSVFVILPGALKIAGTGALLALLGAMVVGVCMAFVYAELASAFPHTGGEYVFVARTLGSGAGFTFLGLTVIGAVLSPAVLALGVGEYLANLVPGLAAPPVAACIIAGATLLGILNIKANAVLTGVFLGIELLALGILAYLGFSHVSRPLWPMLAEPVTLLEGHLASAPMPAIGLATSLAIFAYNGYGGAVYFGEEMRDASARVARTVLWALTLGVATQIIPVTAVLLGAPDLLALFASEMPFNDFIVSRGGAATNVIVSACVVLAMINAVIVLMLGNARLLFSTGRDQAWTRSVNDWLVRVHPRFRSPWAATLIAGAVSTLPCWIDLRILLIFTGTSLIAIYAGICVAAIAGRRSGGTRHGKYRMPWFPVAPAFCLVVLFYVAYTNWIDPDIGRPSLLVNLAVMALSAMYYRWVIRRRGVWKLTGPADENAVGR
jgi:amino acid transporter